MRKEFVDGLGYALVNGAGEIMELLPEEPAEVNEDEHEIELLYGMHHGFVFDDDRH